METLVKRAKEEADSFAELYQAHVGPVYNFFLARVGNVQEAEELTSDTWEIVVKKLYSLRSNELLAFRAWLFQIAKNLLKKKWGKREEVTVAYEEFLDNRVEEEGANSGLSREELKKLWGFVKELPEKQRETVLLRFASDLQNREIAKTMGTSEKTVASNLSRALETLRKNAEVCSNFS